MNTEDKTIFEIISDERKKRDAQISRKIAKSILSKTKSTPSRIDIPVSDDDIPSTNGYSISDISIDDVCVPLTEENMNNGYEPEENEFFNPFKKIKPKIIGKKVPQCKNPFDIEIRDININDNFGYSEDGTECRVQHVNYDGSSEESKVCKEGHSYYLPVSDDDSYLDIDNNEDDVVYNSSDCDAYSTDVHSVSNDSNADDIIDELFANIENTTAFINQNNEDSKKNIDGRHIKKSSVKSIKNNYTQPPIDIFDNPLSSVEDYNYEMEINSRKLIDALESFGVKAKIIAMSHGPSVTRYEVQPDVGVKISRITNLSDDIAMNLSAPSIRIEAPIPGRPAVGIEIPNKNRRSVYIRGLFETQSFKSAKSPLTTVVGVDIAGETVCADLCKMPHLLVAGSTGSGKSVCINSIIISLIYRCSPNDMKLMLIDPKVVELSDYNGIPHLLMPVVTDAKKAAGALGCAVTEMERRYKLFAENGARDISGYNTIARKNRGAMEHLPYIAIIIDELADLMMVSGKEVEDYICRIAQKARAAGMHLIVATQRPSVDVITGLIKANIPSRIAFSVSSQIDSRTILDSAGAEKLLGMGDMLFMPIGMSKPVRLQGPFVKDDEIRKFISFIKESGDVVYNEEMISEMERIATSSGGKSSSGVLDSSSGGDLDPMVEQAAYTVLEFGQASTSLLQRRCKLGYARAARIMDELGDLGIIGPYNGAKPRQVIMSKSEVQELFLSKK